MLQLFLFATELVFIVLSGCMFCNITLLSLGKINLAVVMLCCVAFEMLKQLSFRAQSEFIVRSSEVPLLGGRSTVI